MIVDVFNCARCEEDHKGLSFLEFTGKPIVDKDGIWNYWAICPVTQDPVLLRVTPDEANREVDKNIVITIYPPDPQSRLVFVPYPYLHTPL